MRDWEQLVRDRLARGRESAMVEPEVAEELAHHLEDVCEEGRRRGLSEEDSVDRAWAEVKNWPRLARKINQARGGNEMLKQRIHRLWLPGMVSMTVAMVILYAGLLAGRQPRMMEISPKMSVFMYLAWLLVLPALGALAGYWSRRAGGSVANRAAAALFTPVTMFAICSTVLFLEVFADHGREASGIFMVLLSNTLLGVLIGGMLLLAVALLAGAWPSLRDTRRVALFTALTMVAIYLVVLIRAVFSDDPMKASGVFTDLISSIIGGILLPATALLIGALPFLRESSPQGQAADDDRRVGTA